MAAASLPGKPDVYFPKAKVAIFLDGFCTVVDGADMFHTNSLSGLQRLDAIKRGTKEIHGY